MAKPALSQVEDLIKGGRLEDAQALLSKTTKLQQLTPMQRVTASIHFHWLGKTHEAMRILGPILNPSELASAANENLYLQIRRGQLLAFSGANFVAEGIFRDVETEIRKRGRDFTRDFPQYHRSLADYYINRGDFLRAQDHFIQVIESVKPNDQASRFAKIGICDCLESLGRSPEAIEIISDFIAKLGAEDRTIKAIALQARGEYYFRAQQWTLARADFESAFSQFDDGNETKDFAYLLKWSGALSLQEGDRARAERELMKAYEILNQPQGQPQALMEVLFWLEKLKGDSLPRDTRIALRAHPCLSNFSLLMGSTHSPPVPQLPPWLKSQVPTFRAPIWKIGEKISSGAYADFFAEIPRVPTLDLVSGIVHLPDRPCEILSAIECNFLIGAVGAGSIGVNDWALVDIIYKQRFSEFESGFDRLKALARHLKDKGINLQRENGSWRWKQEDWIVLLPSDLRYIGPQAWLSATHQQFSRTDVEKTFTVSSRTANRWIQEWQLQDLIKSAKSGKVVYYQFSK